MKSFLKIYCLVFCFGVFFYSCEETVEGCTDSTACNYDPSATEDDGSCCIPSDTVIEITSMESPVYGQVGGDLESYAYIKNASCNQAEIMVRKVTSFNPLDPSQASAYFCLAGECVDASVSVSTKSLSLEPCQEADSDVDGDGVVDYFKGYFSADQPGAYEVKYRFFLEDDIETATEITIAYILSDSE